MMEIQLNDGRLITLESIDQYKTYAGLMAGVPNDDINERFIESALKQAEKRNGVTPHLIEPDIKTVEQFGAIGKYLPSTCCIAMFDSGPKDGSDDDLSYICLVWFQDYFAFPIADSALKKIMSVDWEKHALGGNY